MIKYNPKYLENIDIFTKDELLLLKNLNDEVSLSKFLNNKSYVDKFGMDFIHTSAQIEGNTYDKIDTQALLEYGRTAGGKKYSDAKMILNLRDAYDKLINEDLILDIATFKDLHYLLSDEMIADNERAVPRDKEVLIKGCDYIPLATKERLDVELKYLFEKADSINNPFNKALYIHNNLAYLQYFVDCNKRTARVMLNISLKDNDCMIYIPDEEKIKDYLSGIVSYYETGEHKIFKDYFIQDYQKTIKEIVQVEEYKKKEQEANKNKGIK
jgi:Fic family protein